MPEMGTSGLMSGDGKRRGRSLSALAPILDSTGFGPWEHTDNLLASPGN